MPYRLNYSFSIEWVGTGLGPVTGPNAQKLKLVQQAGGQNVLGGGTGGALNGTDVTTLTNAAAVDMAAQLNANIAIPDGWISGGG